MKNEACDAQHSPFKFLDPYGPDDGDIFFGRNSELAELYAKLYSAQLTVVYGESGTGKTSLIQCGLRNRIPLEDMLFVSVRTAGAPDEALREALLKAVPQITDGGEALGDLLRRVIRRSYKSMLLIFDQFEEFLLFQSEDMRRQFLRQLADLLTLGLDLRLLFVIRQEYLAPFRALEDSLPSLNSNGLWLRRMSREQAETVITGHCAKVGVAIAPAPVELVLNALSSRDQGIDLPTLQVVLDSLYQQALTLSDSSPVISAEVYQGLGQIHTILARFLDARISALGGQAEIARQVLKTLVSAEVTSRPATKQDIIRRLAHDFCVELSLADCTVLLETLVRERILREAPDRYCYELRHESLAPHVRSWMSELEQELEALRKSLEQRFWEFQRNRRLLDAGFLADLVPYENRLLLEEPLAEFVQSSKKALQTELERKQLQKAARLKQRQYLVITVTAAFFLVFAGFGVFSAVQWHKADVQKAQAERQKQQAVAYFHKALQAVEEFYIQVSESTLMNKPGMEPLRKDLLEKALSFYQDLSQQQTQDAGLRQDLADATFRVAGIRQMLGDCPMTEAAYRSCIGQYEALAHEHPELAAGGKGLVQSYIQLGHLQSHAGHAAKAQASYQKALEIETRLAQEKPQEPEYQQVLGALHHSLAGMQLESGDLAGARGSFRQAAEIFGRLAQDHTDSPAYRVGWADAEAGLAWVELLDNKPKAAIIAAARALDIDPKHTGIKTKLAHGLLLDGQYDKALAIYTENRDAKLDGGQPFAEVVLDEFRQLRAKHISHPDMLKIEKLMQKKS